MQAENQPLPRFPELYLEAGAALLMAQRAADCITLCDDIISMTLELLPERLVLEEPEERFEAEAEAVCVQRLGSERDQVAMLLWTGTAYLLEGHCHTQLNDWKQAVTHYTRLAKCNFIYFIHCYSSIQTQSLYSALQVYQPACEGVL